jgi:hypothetical protein
MATESSRYITKEDVAEFSRRMREEQASQTPADAVKKLISSGFLREDGKVRFPNPADPKPKGTKRVNGHK